MYPVCKVNTYNAEDSRKSFCTDDTSAPSPERYFIIRDQDDECCLEEAPALRSVSVLGPTARPEIHDQLSDRVNGWHLDESVNSGARIAGADDAMLRSREHTSEAIPLRDAFSFWTPVYDKTTFGETTDVSGSHRTGPPIVQRYFPLERTKFVVYNVNGLVDLTVLLRLESVFVDDSLAGHFKLKCSAYVDHDMLQFAVKLFVADVNDGSMWLEFQRRQGCARAWAYFYEAVQVLFIKQEKDKAPLIPTVNSVVYATSKVILPLGSAVEQGVSEGNTRTGLIRHVEEAMADNWRLKRQSMSTWDAEDSQAKRLRVGGPVGAGSNDENEHAADEMQDDEEADEDEAAQVTANMVLERTIQSKYLDTQQQGVQILAKLAATGVVYIMQSAKLCEQLKSLLESKEEMIRLLAVSTIADLVLSWNVLGEPQRAFLASCTPALMKNVSMQLDTATAHHHHSFRSSSATSGGEPSQEQHQHLGSFYASSSASTSTLSSMSSCSSHIRRESARALANLFEVGLNDEVKAVKDDVEAKLQAAIQMGFTAGETMDPLYSSFAHTALKIFTAY